MHACVRQRCLAGSLIATVYHLEHSRILRSRCIGRYMMVSAVESVDTVLKHILQVSNRQLTTKNVLGTLGNHFGPLTTCGSIIYHPDTVCGVSAILLRKVLVLDQLLPPT